MDSKTPSTVGLIFNLLKIPLSLILIKIFGVAGIWISVNLTSVFKGLIGVLLLSKKVKSDFANL